MKKTIILLVLILLMTSVVAYADQSYAISYNSNEESSQNLDTSHSTYERKWISNYSIFYKTGTTIKGTIAYSDSHGYTGTLTLIGITWTDDGAMAFYQGWVYRGSVQPFGFPENN